jgi:hypothetical protein
MRCLPACRSTTSPALFSNLHVLRERTRCATSTQRIDDPVPDTGRGLDHPGDSPYRPRRRHLSRNSALRGSVLGGGNVSDHEEAQPPRHRWRDEPHTVRGGSPDSVVRQALAAGVQAWLPLPCRAARKSPSEAVSGPGRPGARAFRRVRSTRRVGCRVPRASSWGSRWVTGGVRRPSRCRPNMERRRSAASDGGPLSRGGEGAPRQSLARA